MMHHFYKGGGLGTFENFDGFNRSIIQFAMEVKIITLYLSSCYIKQLAIKMKVPESKLYFEVIFTWLFFL